jgi:hypothetical protein
VLRRGRSTLQIGLDPDRAVVIDQLSDDAGTALMHLDGVTGRHQLLTLAPELDAVLDELHHRGLLDDDPGPSTTLSKQRRARQHAELAALAVELGSSPDALALMTHRARSTVTIRGNDLAATHIALGLAAAGVGSVALDGPDRVVTEHDLTPLGPHEAGPSWRQEVSEALRRQGTRPTSATRTPPALVVVCSAADVDLPWTDPELADDLLADGVVHLAVAVSGPAARVGPLVLPGRSACLWCLDRRACDLDPAWPALTDQLRLRHGAARTRSTALATLAAAFAVTECLAVLDRRDGAVVGATVDAQIEFRLDDPLPRVLRGPRHPACGCGWAGETDTMAG